MHATETTTRPRSGALLRVAFAYIIAIGAGAATLAGMQGAHPLLAAWWADVVATLVIFAFSYAYDNSSFYDPYWSVAPPLLVLYWGLHPSAGEGNVARALLLWGLVAVWGVRLTYNWARGWQGLAHEDWRYRDIRAKTGRWYWWVSFLGIHLFPTAMVFACLLPAYAALTSPHAFWVFDIVAALVVTAAIWLEATADNQLRQHVRTAPNPGPTLQTGLWAYSRHPNYVGEILFWWGLWCFAFAANAHHGWTWIGPVALVLMFQFVSLPLIERRMRRRRPDYDDYRQRVSKLVPWFPKHKQPHA